MSQMLSAVRNSCFAILSAIEIDVRLFIETEIDVTLHDRLLPADVCENARERMLNDPKRSPAVRSNKELDLLEYTDFSDLSKILFANSGAFPSFPQPLIKRIAEKLAAMSAPRNRVCHSRPLDDDDLTRFVDLATSLITSFPTFSWDTLRDIEGKRRSDPSFIFRLEIPSFWKLGSTETSHNLPMPDFDETGLLGRTNDRKQVLAHLRGPHPVITIVGEGGIGIHFALQRESASSVMKVVGAACKSPVAMTKPML
jgi:LuxR family transcriptional regulator, glucitol operon activator